MDIGSGCGGRSRHDGKGKRKRSREEASANCPRPSAAVDALATIRAVYGSTDDSDLPPVLPHRRQAQGKGHADATPTTAAAAAAAATTAVEETTAAARRILMRMRTGMPFPKQDGGLRTIANNSGDEASWDNLCKNRAPYFALGSSEVRARRHKKRGSPGGASVWTDDAKQLAMEEFMFEGDVVFVVPEVSGKRSCLRTGTCSCLRTSTCTCMYLLPPVLGIKRPYRSLYEQQNHLYISGDSGA